MTFNDTATYQGICQDTRGILGLGVTDTISYPDSDIARNSNVHYRNAVALIWDAVGDWEYDDSNKTDMPIATTTLVDDQADYELPSGAQKLERVEVKDDEGDYKLMTPMTKEQITDRAMTEIFSESGMPQFYDVIGRSIILYPTPSTDHVTASAGLKIYVSRDITEFNATTTTREPGFANNFHRYIPVGNALDFANAKGMLDKIKFFTAQKDMIEKEMKTFYSRRHARSFRNKIRTKQESFV